MKDKRNEKWLDDQITKAINTTKPHFDLEEWKAKYPEEFQMLKAPAAPETSTPLQRICHAIVKNPLTKIAAAAAVIVIAAVIFFSGKPDQPLETANYAEPTKSPATMMTAMSLNIAYRKGGMAAVEKQCERAFKLLGPRPGSISVKELLAELNNGNS